MNTRQYQQLTVIADCGSLTYAAQRLDVTPSALSKFLAECERQLGFALFLRYRRQLYPTAVGRYVIECAHKILDEQTRMLLTMRSVSGSAHNRIRLATAPNRGAIIYSKIYNQFSRRFPDINLSLTELYASEQPAAVAQGRVDLAIGAGSISEACADIPFAHEELLVSLPVSHPLAGQARIRLADLRDTPFVLQGRRHSIRIIAELLFQEAGFYPVVAFESDDVILIDSMLHQAIGAGLVSRAHVFPCPELVYRPLDPPVYQTQHIRHPHGHELTEPEHYLASLLVRERLADERYQPIPSPVVQSFLRDEPLPELAPPKVEPTTGDAPSAANVTLDTRVLEYLTAIVEEQSLSRAADRFFLAQPALSRHLRNVESMVGMALFTREHNRLLPTSAGTVFVNNARNMLHIENEMFARAQDYRDGHGGNIYISCDPIAAETMRDSVTKAFAKLHPEITLNLVEGNCSQTQEALLNASADVGIYFSTEPTLPLLHCDVLALTELVYCFAADAVPRGWQPGDPLPADFMPRAQLLADAGTTLRAEQNKILAEFSPTMPDILCEAHFSVLQPLANAGTADSILPLHLLDRKIFDRCAAFEPPRPFYLLLARHVGRTLPKAATDLYALLADTFADALAIRHSEA